MSAETEIHITDPDPPHGTSPFKTTLCGADPSNRAVAITLASAELMGDPCELCAKYYIELV